MIFPARALAAGVCLAAALLLSAAASADTLKITSTPSGATVELDGVVVGTTPYEVKYPGGYFHRTKTIYGTLLQHPMRVRISLKGYLTKELLLTDGPMERVNTTGKVREQYYLLKSDHFQFALEKVADTLTGSLEAHSPAGIRPAAKRELPVEEIVQHASPAVVLLRGPRKQGTGFLITATGVIATNAHVVRDEPRITALISRQQELPAHVVYIDADLDFALLKVEASAMPHLVLADLGSVAAGQTVLAIGNPGGGMPNSVTKGIVSAVGPEPELGPGIWIQTDAAVNPGNSGGPLLDTAGEVIGMNTARAVAAPAGAPVSGIGFALSSADILHVLRRFYPAASLERLSAPANSDTGEGTVHITSEPAGAEISVDGNFVGTTPSNLRLPAGPHDIELKSAAHQPWRRTLNVLKDSDVSLNATLAPDR